MKLNFDGASRANLGLLGLGDNQGNVISLTISPLPIDTNKITEAHALFAVLILDK